VIRRAFVACVAAALLAGCGAGGDGGGKAQVWITRDRGTHVLAVRTVPAGLTGMQALDRVAAIDTRYGGRFVESINGHRGSLRARRDWFYFVNGIEGDRSAAEYRLRDGDIEWWDLRSWKREMSVPVVVGAWPQPVYGDAQIIARDHKAGPAANALGLSIDADEHGRYLVLVQSKDAVFHGERRDGEVSFVIDTEDAQRLARNPKLARFRYEGLP
jgi:hypothetical protein